jgi:hypothetical protein
METEEISETPRFSSTLAKPIAWKEFRALSALKDSNLA